jgi:hypothetical protein
VRKAIDLQRQANFCLVCLGPSNDDVPLPTTTPINAPDGLKTEFKSRLEASKHLHDMQVSRCHSHRWEM